MHANIGAIDRALRVAIGLVLIAFALRLGFAETGWNWLGWIGIVPIATAIFGFCPLYTFLQCSTR